RNEVLPNILNGLDELARGVIDNVNSLHRKGYGMDRESNLDFFSGQDAATIAVNTALVSNPESIAAAGVPNSIGDISVAMSIADLATKPAMGAGNTVSINGFFRGIITNLGMEIQKAQASSDSSRTVVEHLSDRRQAVSGVA